MENEYVKLIITFLLSSTFIGFVQFLINRHDSKQNKFTELEGLIKKGLEERSAEGKERFDYHEKANQETLEAINALKQVLSQLTDNFDKQSEILSANSQVVVGLAQDRLVFLCDKYQKRGGITNDEIAMLNSIYNPYHNSVLKGNGRGQAGYEYCVNKLPRITSDEAKELDEKLAKKSYNQIEKKIDSLSLANNDAPLNSVDL